MADICVPTGQTACQMLSKDASLGSIQNNLDTLEIVDKHGEIFQCGLIGEANIGQLFLQDLRWFFNQEQFLVTVASRI